MHRTTIFFFLLQLVLLISQSSSTIATPPLSPPLNMSLLDCPTKCGDVDIPYPFGTIDGCYYGGDHHFYIECDETTSKPLHGNFPLLNISVDGGFLRVLTTVASDCYGADKNESDPDTYTTNKHLGRFHFSATRNKFTGVGCDTVAFLLDAAKNASVGCLSICGSADSVRDGVCNGGGCCQNSDLPFGLQNLTLFLRSFNDHKDVKDFDPCSYAFLVDEEDFWFNKSYYFRTDLASVPTVIDWAVGHGTNCSEGMMNPASYACKENSECVDSVHGDGYLCNCSSGFYGNPYIGCQDIDECGNPELYPCNGTCYNTVGNWSCVPPKKAEKDQSLVYMIIAIGSSVAFIALVIESCLIYKGLKKRKQRHLKRAFFKRNGGLMLQDNLSQVEHAQSAFKIFTAEEMEAATNNFDKSRIVGSGGFADVYKGHLSDGTIVAIKKPKSKSLEGSEDVQFINEVLLLSKIQHHNVVTFLGCCLEAEAPLLVYEFISNGTLHDHLHGKEGGKPRLSWEHWEARLKIAAETAGVLAYLHHDHRPSIIHSDIKPHNILLGDDFTAKVSDFGISKLAPQNETELYTKVKGTLGYLDPEFIQSGQLTEKSDVYSFGVVVLELLTGQKVLSFTRQKEDWCLVNYFKSSFASGCFTDTLDNSVVGDENIKQIREVAEIAMLCVSVKSEERPTMKEVAMELGGMMMEGKNKAWVNHNNNSEEREQLLNRAMQSYTSYSSGGYSSSGTGDYIIMAPDDGSR